MRYVQSTSCLMFAQRWSSQAPEAWRSGRWIHRVHHRFNGSLPLPRPHAGMCARRRSNFLLRRQEKVTKEKATPLLVSPSLRCGATCGARFRRGPRKLASLKQRAALIRLKLCSSARTEGMGSRAALRAIAALGPGLRTVRAQAAGPDSEPRRHWGLSATVGSRFRAAKLVLRPQSRNDGRHGCFLLFMPEAAR